MTAAWLALSALSAAVAVGLALAVHVVVYAYKEGRKAERLAQAEARLRALEARADHQPELGAAVEVLKSSLDALREGLAELRGELARRIDRLEHDIRNILTGKVTPARRSGER
jgi:hypothetical protein